MEKPVSVFLLIPQVCVKKIKMDPTLPFSTFNRLFNKSEKKMYIYNGNIMKEECKIKEIGLKDNDTVIATNKETEYSESTISWLRISNDIDYFNEKVQDYIKMDPLTFSRIKDNLKNRNKINYKISKYNEKENLKFNINYEKENSPNNNALPLF